MYDREKKAPPKDTLFKIIGAFNLLVSFGYLGGKTKTRMQQKIMTDVKAREMKCQANQNSIETLEHT